MNESRYARLELIDWWDGRRVRNARALVVGAGALGSEVVKNLALLGWGLIVVADHDEVAASNLSRSVLHTADDVGMPKASSLARSAGRVNPDVRVVALDRDVRIAASAGLLSRVDLVFGCVDNLAARVSISQLAGRAGCLYIDGGLSTWEGSVRIFDSPDGPCYTCGLTPDDLRELALRRSCLAYQRRAVAQQGVATTPTVSSVTAATMVQQALKWLHRDRHDLPVQIGRELRFDAAFDRFWNTELTRDEECPLHPERVHAVAVDELRWDLPWADLIARIRQRLDDPRATVNLPVQVLTGWRCSDCAETDNTVRAYSGDAPLHCHACAAPVVPDLTNVVTGAETWADRSPMQVGLPPWTWLDLPDGSTVELAGAPPEFAAVRAAEPAETVS